MQQTFTQRIASIDVLRALTMLLMVFVNDLWTLRDIPIWLEHAAASEDRLGFADTIFPAFLFIVGLSIPFGLGNRLRRGDPPSEVTKHVFLRSLALLVMGVFHVNLESYADTAALLPRPAWEILITIGFFLIWLDYPKTMISSKRRMLQGAGVLLLAAMALVYKGGDDGHPEWMRFHWWGILGLIGWAYLIGGLLYVIFRNRIAAYGLLFLFFMMFSSLEKLGFLAALDPVRQYVWIVGDGAMPALVLAGVFVSLCYTRLGWRRERNTVLFFTLCSSVMFAFAYLTRPWWGIHKIDASPSWVAISIGYTILVFLSLTWLVDRNGKGDLFLAIRPAGTSTLTAYLLPYLHYPVYSMIGISLPLALRTGGVGIVKCLLYAFVIVLATGWLEKKRIRLKL